MCAHAHAHTRTHTTRCPNSQHYFSLPRLSRAEEKLAKRPPNISAAHLKDKRQGPWTKWGQRHARSEASPHSWGSGSRQMHLSVRGLHCCKTCPFHAFQGPARPASLHGSLTSGRSGSIHPSPAAWSRTLTSCPPREPLRMEHHSCLTHGETEASED